MGFSRKTERLLGQQQQIIIAVKQTSMADQLTQHEKQLKQKHLKASSELISKKSHPALSTYFALINHQQQPTGTTNHLPHSQHEAINKKLRWCDQCLASCSIKIKLKTQQVVLTCQRPSCQRLTIEPLSTWR